MLACVDCAQAAVLRCKMHHPDVYSKLKVDAYTHTLKLITCLARAWHSDLLIWHMCEQVLALGASGHLQYEEVFMFSHWDAHVVAVHINLCLHGDVCISATAGHYIWSSLAEARASEALSFEHHAKPVAARNIQIGSLVWLADGTGALRPHAVQTKEHGLAQGLFNPHVASGGLVVNGVAALTFSDILPPSVRWHAAVSLPGRLLYSCMPSLRLAAWVNRSLLASAPSAAVHRTIEALISWVSQHRAHA